MKNLLLLFNLLAFISNKAQVSTISYSNELCLEELYKEQIICLNSNLTKDNGPMVSSCLYADPIPNYDNTAGVSCGMIPIIDGAVNINAYYNLELKCVNRMYDVSIFRISQDCWKVIYIDTGIFLYNINVNSRMGREIDGHLCYDTSWFNNCGVDRVWKSFTVNVSDTNNCNEYTKDSCNLIYNGGFDDYTTCPTRQDIYNIDYLQNWSYASASASWVYPGLFNDCGTNFGDFVYGGYASQPLPSKGGYVSLNYNGGLGQKIDLCTNQKYAWSAYLMRGKGSLGSIPGNFEINGVNTVSFPTTNAQTNLATVSGTTLNLYYNWHYFSGSFFTTNNYNGVVVKSNAGAPIFLDNFSIIPIDTVIFNTQLIANRCDSADMILTIPGCYGPYNLELAINNDTLTYQQVQDGHTIKIPLAKTNIVKVLSITNSLGCATVLNTADTLVVNNAGNANFASSDFCEGQSNTVTIFADTGVFSLVNNATSATINPNTGVISGAVAGTYIIQHAVCLDTVYDTIQAFNAIASFTSSNICVGGANTVNITGTTGGTFSLIPPSAGATINPSTGVVSGGIAGNSYTIKYVVSGLCPDSSIQTIQVVAIEDPSFTTTNFCVNDTNSITIQGTVGGTFSFSPQPTDGATINPASGKISNATANASYTIKYVTPGNCKDSSTQMVQVYDIPAGTLSGGSGDLCLQDSVALQVNLTGTPPFNYGVQQGGNVPVYFSTPNTTDTVWVDSLGNYKIVNVQDANGCYAIPDSVIIPVKGDSLYVYVNADSGCSPLQVQYISNVIGLNGDCIWNLGDGTSLNLCDTVLHTYYNAGNYAVYLNVNSSKCTGSVTYQNIVFVTDTPQANFYAIPQTPTVINNKVNMTNTSYDNDSNYWFVNNGFVSSNVNPSFQLPAVIGQHEICLEVVNQYNCRDTTCSYLNVFDESLIYIPNAFNPNNDGLNEEFKPVVSNVQLYNLQVFNRWGQLVFETLDENEGWDGTFKGAKCEAGVYVYKLSYRYKGNYDDHFKRGHFTLLR